MTNSTGAVVDPVDPAVVLGALTSMLEDTEASIVRLQAVREAQLAVAQRLAEELAAQTRPARGEAADLSQRAVAAELAAVLHMSDRVVQGRMMRAADLMAKYPETMRAFTEARINAAHVRLIQDAGARLDDEVRAEFERLAVAACEGDTPHRARPIIERVTERLAPRSLTERHRQAQEKRTVWREDLPDGQKMLGITHAAAVIDGIYDRLTQQARMLKTANMKAAKDAAAGLDPDSDGLGDPADERTIDQLRADLCADTLLAGTRPDTTPRPGCCPRSRAGWRSPSPCSPPWRWTPTRLPSPADAVVDARASWAQRSACVPSCPRSSPAGSPSTRTPPASSPAVPPRGSACSPTPSPGRSSPSIATGPMRTCADCCTLEIPGAGSLPADSRPAPRTSTTPSTPHSAERPRKGTWAASADDTTC
ncbi:MULTISPECIES: DUF222 domain-containing protein [unclassified Microbacterium]|uniref:DUF222 domain-containing protein n=1 Tax=unclassified Microbacterium TaxID=2609290 RepID=UPI00301B4C1B